MAGPKFLAMTDDDPDIARHLFLADLCMGLGVPFMWRSLGTMLVGGPGAKDVVRASLNRGYSILGLEGFVLESTLMRPQPELALRVCSGPSDALAAMSTSTGEIWIDVAIDKEPPTQGLVDFALPIEKAGDCRPYLAIVARSMMLRAPCVWHAPGTVLVAGSAVDEVVRQSCAGGVGTIRLQRFYLESTAIRPRLDCIYDAGLTSLTAYETVASWPSDVWVDVLLRSARASPKE